MSIGSSRLQTKLRSRAAPAPAWRLQRPERPDVDKGMKGSFEPLALSITDPELTAHNAHGAAAHNVDGDTPRSPQPTSVGNCLLAPVHNVDSSFSDHQRSKHAHGKEGR